jgi:hypothetical protein
MDSVAFDLGERLNNRKIEFILHKPMWDKFVYPTLDLTLPKWTVVKYLNASGKSFHKDVESIPNTKGGLYLFFVKCKIITGMTEYPLYIGRAQYTQGQNLRKRIKEYFQKYSANNERPKIYRMLRYWGKELYVAYYPLTTNAAIVNVERDIINSLLLPMNDAIPDKTIKKAIKAFK